MMKHLQTTSLGAQPQNGAVAFMSCALQCRERLQHGSSKKLQDVCWDSTALMIVTL